MMDRLAQLTLIATFLCAVHAQEISSLGGRVVDAQTGDAVAGATVLAIRDTSEPVKGGPEFQTATTTDDGSYSIADLPNGSYRICVQSAEHLDPCAGRPEAYVRTQIGGKSASLNLSLQKAAVIRVSVEDPSANLQAKEGKQEGAHLLIGIVDESGLFQTFTLASTSPTHRVYEGRVRPGSSARLIVHAEQFSLANSEGSPIEGKSLSIPIETSQEGLPNERTIRIREQ